MNRRTPHLVAGSRDQQLHHDAHIRHVEATLPAAHHSPLAQVRRPLPQLPRPSIPAPLATSHHRAHSPIDLPRSVDDEDDLWNFETLLTSYYFDPALDVDNASSSSSTLVSVAQRPGSSCMDRARASVIQSDVRETIRQLEAIADDLRAMDTEASSSQLSSELPYQRYSRENCTSPTNSDESGSTDSHCSSSSSNSSTSYHAPILKGALSFHDWHDRDTALSFDFDFPFGMDIPRIMITIPSSDDLADDEDKEPCSPQVCPWRRAHLWDGEPDEVKWVEEYGHWHDTPHSITAKRREDSETWSDSDSDVSSDSDSLWHSMRETSSISTSPPSSPVSPRDSPPSYSKYGPPALPLPPTPPLRFPPTPKLSYPSSPALPFPPTPTLSHPPTPRSAYPPSPALPFPPTPLLPSSPAPPTLTRPRSKLPPPQPIFPPPPSPSESLSHPALWLCHIVSKPFLEHKYRRMRKLQKKPQMDSYTPLDDYGMVEPYTLRERPLLEDVLIGPGYDDDALASPAFSEIGFPRTRAAMLAMGEQQNRSSWSLDSSDTQRRGGLGRLFRRRRP